MTRFLAPHWVLLHPTQARGAVASMARASSTSTAPPRRPGPAAAAPVTRWGLPPTGKDVAQAAAAVVVAASAALALQAAPAAALEVEKRFELSCAGCHANGGNVVQPGATLQTGDLQKNGVADVDALYKLIYSGRGKMPGFGTDCAPKGACTFGPRLADDEVRALAEYVLDQAAAGWKQQ